MNLTDADVAEILRILDATPYSELEIETDRFRITLQRGEGGGWRQQRESLATPKRLDIEAAAPAVARPATSKTVVPDDGLLNVLAPIVGTFYRSPQPGAAPFVEVGSRVTPETVVAIIEVMKLMSSVPAGVAGEVVEIVAANAELVQPGACLLRVKPEPILPLIPSATAP